MIRCFLVITMLALSMTVFAQPTRDQAKKIVPPISKNQVTPGPKLGPPINPEIPKPMLSIAALRIHRLEETKTIALELEAHNTNFKAAESEYIFERWTGTTWVAVGRGVVKVPGRGHIYTTAKVPYSVDALQVRVRVPQSVEGMREARLARHVYIIRYRCPEWRIASTLVGRPGESIGSVGERSIHTAFLRSAGFEVSFHGRKGARDEYEVTTSYRAPQWLVREFTEARMASEFFNRVSALRAEHVFTPPETLAVSPK